jgi:hypothetical protein
MEYSQKPVMNTAPAPMHMPMSMSMPMHMPMPNPVAPITAAPNMKPAHHGPVSVNFVNMHAVEHCHPKAPVFSSTGVILVLFILLVIISRAKC